jgi:hypothetical protein
MPAADEGWDEYDDVPVPAAPVFSAPPPAPEPDPALIELQRTVGELQDQLAGQRDALTALLSEREQAAPVTRRYPAAAAYPAASAREDLAPDMHTTVADLLAEGLSERTIARRLHIGLEEVRLAARREERVS